MSEAPMKRLSLTESLGPAEATDLADKLRTLRGTPLEIEAHSVRRLGGLCVQVLISAAATWRADSIALRLIEPSPEVEESLRLLGLSADALSAGEPA
jgi:chemotaxis protein CheX